MHNQTAELHESCTVRLFSVLMFWLKINLPWVDAGPMTMNIDSCHSNNRTNQKRTKNDDAESRMTGWYQKNHTGHNKALNLNRQHPGPNHALNSTKNHFRIYMFSIKIINNWIQTYPLLQWIELIDEENIMPHVLCTGFMIYCWNINDAEVMKIFHTNL